MSGQKERPAVSAAGLVIPLGSECEKHSTLIPAEAIESAARALHFFKTGAGWKDADPATVWECNEQAESILRQAEQFRPTK